MPTWNAEQYLRFNDERSRPCRELAARVSVAAPARVIDLGCGPGNSTAILADRWPQVELSGMDSSPEMIAAATRDQPGRKWSVGDIGKWAEESDGGYDVVFSNAALQWVEDHAAVFPRLLKRVNPGGALAIQMPGNFDAPAHVIMRDIAESSVWRGRFPQRGVREWHVHELPDYYDMLAGEAASVDLWQTEYHHIMPDAAAIVEWYKGTGLRPFLDALGDETLKKDFLAEYLQRVRQEYPTRKDGKVIFPFKRFFVIAYQR